jgi:sugar lactone lactonase YvrE
MRAENLTGPVAGHAEAPTWWPGWGGIRWVDGYAGDLLTLHADGSLHRMSVGSSFSAFVRPRAGGGYVVATERGLAMAERGDDRPVPVIELVDAPGIRLNDGGADAAGRLYVGSMAYDNRAGAGRLVRVDPAADGTFSVHPVLDAVTISNGLGFSPDGSRMYYIDTPTGRVDVFDHSDGVLTDRRPFAHIDAVAGSPDGLTVAADGSIWVALWGGSCVHGYDASGALIEVVEVDARQTSACTFGGDDLATLYITTSRQGLADGDDPEAGSLFTARPGVTGMPALPFAG